MSFTADPAEGKRVHDLDRAHVFHSWSAQAQINPMDIAAAEGCYVWDYDGNRYLDLSSQLVNVNIGHQHPKVVKAIQDQAAKMATIAPQHANDVRGEAAKRIVDARPGRHEQGLLHQRRRRRQRERRPDGAPAHGQAEGAAAPTARTTATPPSRSRRPATRVAGRTSTPSHQVHFFGPYPYRSSFWSTTPEQESERALAAPRAGHPVRGPGHDRGHPARVRRRHRRRPHPAAAATWRASAPCATATASSSSPTRSWPASAARGGGSRSSTSTSRPT